ncbi:MAG: (2,3-dihydroxybenzoyl)adenylate synthase [Rhodospirillales bacterium]|nr:MAG: (2,3-dihydroxybenzoyl)adenylate synthase [Rhodospirillales bacterium]
MLEGCVPWPEDFAKRYRALGLWQDITLFEMLEQSAAKWPERIALVDSTERLTYAELVRRAKRLSEGLRDLGLKPLDRTVFQINNQASFAIAFFALVRIGVIPVMALPPHRQNEIRHFLKFSGATAYLIPDRMRGFDCRVMALEMKAEIPSLRHIIVAGEACEGQVSLNSLISTDAPPPAFRPDPSEVALMLLSGGTTALPKLIPRTHNDYVLNARLAGEACGFCEDTVYLAVLPLAHNYSLACPGMLATLYHGGRVVIAPAHDPDTIFGLVEKERVTLIPAAVPLIAGWVTSDIPRKYDLSSLKIVQNGGARLSTELRKKLRAHLGCLTQEDYGTAEGLINLTRADDPEEVQLTSSGCPICDEDEIKVLDAEGNEVQDGEPGELAVRGPYTIRGYYNNPAANAKAFTADGFYRMGDIVRKRGRHIWAEGRKGDLINRGGEKISVDEIENLILKHPSVQAVALVAMSDPIYGEKACAFATLKDGASLGFKDLSDFLLAQGIAKFKLPERLEVLDEFPVSPAGKILRRTLRDMIEAKLADEKRN